MAEFGRRLKELRDSRQMSQEDLAKALHVSRSRIGMYEQGQREPDFEMQEAIADFFNVNLDYLVRKHGSGIDLIIHDTNIGPDEAFMIEMMNGMDPASREDLMRYARVLKEHSEFLKKQQSMESDKTKTPL